MKKKLTDSQIYDTLFKAIHEHHLLPETHLPEDDLAKSFDVSRTRVRKILEQLIHEQLVVKLPNKGCFVASMSEKQVNDVFTARKIIEAGIIDLIDFPLKGAVIKHLHKLCQDENNALKQGNLSQANTLSGEFHIYLAKLTNNETLSVMVKQLIARTSLALAVYSNPTTMQCDNHCHHELTNLFVQGNKSKIKDFMLAHLNELENNLIIQPETKKAVNLSELISSLN
ncbi:GntR family transcriptional regulator [Psychrobacter sp.]|uniref:GntR family transcriptional regulator n=1 Tax=Psychrobacter sp. TaxID=56811 RepID=UPI0025EC41A3|nr:GntR family transcriptional regulator [Psychrobacter sp.]